MEKLDNESLGECREAIEIEEELVMVQLTAVLIGAGDRGAHSYAPYAIDYPHELKFIAVAEANPARRENFAKMHGITEERCYESWEQLLDEPQMADIALICTQDRMHYKPTLQALAKQYHLLLEKPMAPDPKECIKMERAARENNRLLRFVTFFDTRRFGPPSSNSLPKAASVKWRKSN